MTIRDKVLVYLSTFVMFLAWETLFIVQMFRDFDMLYLTLALFGVGCLLYMVRVVRTAPLQR